MPASVSSCDERYAESAGPDAGAFRFIQNVVSVAHQVPEKTLHAPTRDRAAIARARQVAIYLTHVSAGASLTDAGASLGRDRTTAAHACHRIEDRRDDPVFDTALDYLDAALRTRIAYRSGTDELCAEQGTREKEETEC